ncbi:zymogen granule membrane protein 16-like [Cyprinus carpio]|uniref:Zymogen granule membrane protein 16-like n=2 Tax=Cyprinus carpio TaxID=7962 RepID=A0A8C2GPG8_CYPCA|nr:zymogen granule membrane protein 16-like [Cyprinus carpio]
MLHLLLILSGVTLGMAMPLPDYYSYSTAVGDGSGTEYSTAYDGRVTGIRVWEYNNAYIRGIQLRYDGNWTTPVCTSYGNPLEMTLRDNESFIQVSGKYSNGYIYEIMFVTSRGRSLKVGLSYGTSFNFYPTNDGSQLRFLSGRQNGNGITSIGAHWAVYSDIA